MAANTGVMDIPGEHYFQANMIATSASNVATFEAQVMTAPVDGWIARVIVTPAAAVTGTDTNNRHLNLDVPDGTEVAALSLVSGVNLTQGASTVVYSAAAGTLGTSMVAGTTVTLENELTGTGLVTPEMLIRATFVPK